MSMPRFDGGRSAVASAPLVVKRRRGSLISGAVAALALALVALVAGAVLSGDQPTLAGLLAAVTGLALLGGIVLAVLAGRARTPLLVADDSGVATGQLPKVRLGWSELERVRVFQTPGGGAAIGIVPRSVDQVAATLFGETANAQKYATRLRSLAQTAGAPIVIHLANTSTDTAAAATALASLAAGRCPVTG